MTESRIWGEMLPDALDLAAKLWKVLPCWPDGPRAKSPIGSLVPNGLKNASTDPDVIFRWWNRFPRAMIGAVVDERLAVLDVDPRHGGSIAALEDAAGCKMTDTVTVISGRNDGGIHFYYWHPGGPLTARRLPPGIDIREGGKAYCIVPPSIHPATGKPYRWGTTDLIAIMPAGITALLRPLPPRHPGPRRTDGLPTNVRARGLLAYVSNAPIGHRNKALFWSASAAVRDGLFDEIADQLIETALAVGLDLDEVENTMRSATKLNDR